MKGEVVIKKTSRAGNGACVYVPKKWSGEWIVCESLGKKFSNKDEVSI